jgi:hypothetical protein
MGEGQLCSCLIEGASPDWKSMIPPIDAPRPSENGRPETPDRETVEIYLARARRTEGEFDKFQWSESGPQAIFCQPSPFRPFWGRQNGHLSV